MATNSQKIWIGSSLNRIASNAAQEAIGLTGKALPCSVLAVMGSIVTVNFLVNATPNLLPPLTVPVFGPEYIRYPIQIGGRGVVFPTDVQIGVASGIGNTATPTLGLPGNLSGSALVFFPIGNATWTPPDDPNALVLYGPDGVIIRDVGKTVTMKVNAGVVAITGNLAVSGTITWGGSVVANTHVHSGVQTGGGDTGPPV